jgi:hypothetical protein
MDKSKTATGSQEILAGGVERMESLTMDLVDRYFSPGIYGPQVRSRAGMLSIVANHRGFEAGKKAAELASELQTPVIKSLNAEVEDYRQDCIRLSKALRHIDEITTGSLPLTYLIKEIIREALAGMPPF